MLNSINSLAIFFAFFPFIAPMPLNTDVQLTFFIVAMLCIATQGLGYKIGAIDFAFWIIILYSGLNQYELEKPNFQGFARFICSYIAFIYFSSFWNKITPKIVFIITCAHFSTLIFQLISPALFLTIAENFMSSIRVTTFGVRGVSGFAPEPGFAGAIAVSLIAINYLTKDFYGKTRYFGISLVLGLISVILTRSGTGTVLLSVFIILYYFKPNVKSLVLAVLAISILVFVVFNFEFGRGTYLLKTFLQDPLYLINSDQSIGARVLSIILTVFAIYENILGTGIGSYEITAESLDAQYDIFQYARGNLNTGKIGSLSMLSFYAIELGLIWLAFISLIFVRGFKNMGVRSIPFLFLAFHFILTSFSLAFPITWLLIAVCNSRVFASSYKRRIQN